MEVLVEIHSHYLQQLDIARKVDWVYDFALPPLILHSLFRRMPDTLATLAIDSPAELRHCARYARRDWHN